MNLDKTWVYRFIRTDLPLEQHIVQLGHASWHAGMQYGHECSLANDGEAMIGIPYNITVGVSGITELKEIANKLTDAGIRWELFTDTDVDADPTALVTFPVEKKQRKKSFLNHGLKLYSPRVPLTPESLASMPSGEPNADVAQLREHSVSNRGVEGANPSVSSNIT